MGYYNVEKRDGYYAIYEPSNVFGYLIVGDKAAALIDTCYGYGDLNEVVREITDLPLIIINTHGHCDHTGGNAWFKDVPCYLNERDWDLAREHCGSEFRRGDAELAKHAMNLKTQEEFNCLPENFDIDAYAAMGTGDLRPVHEGDTFDLGGVTLEIYETPGHTSGGISILHKEARRMFIGDAFSLHVWLFAPEATGRKSYIEMLNRMLNMEADEFIGGHYPFPMHKDIIPRYIQCAEEADYDKAMPFDVFFAKETNPRVYIIEGMTIKDFFDPQFASVVISTDFDK